MMRHRIQFAVAFAILFAAIDVRAALMLHEDFSTYSDGALVGQSGWSEFGKTPSPPLLVAGGQVVLPYRPAPANTFNDGESAAKSIGTVISAPASGTASIYFGASITVD